MTFEWVLVQLGPWLSSDVAVRKLWLRNLIDTIDTRGFRDLQRPFVFAPGLQR